MGGSHLWVGHQFNSGYIHCNISSMYFNMISRYHSISSMYHNISSMYHSISSMYHSISSMYHNISSMYHNMISKPDSAACACACQLLHMSYALVTDVLLRPTYMLCMCNLHVHLVMLMLASNCTQRCRQVDACSTMLCWTAVKLTPPPILTYWGIGCFC